MPLSRLVALCRRRGFVYPGSEIYGGLANSFDFGPLGAQFKRNVTDKWWRDFIERRADCVGLDSAVIMSRAVWEASGHASGFNDPMSSCSCGKRTRADKAAEAAGVVGAESLSLEALGAAIVEHDVRCECCKEVLSAPRNFNLMFSTSVGCAEGSTQETFLRPETAQGAYVNFSTVQSTMRRKLPFGVGQAGKSFRNEITPGHWLFRTREFEQLELQYFVAPEEAEAKYAYWVQACHDWLLELGLSPDKLRVRTHDPDELAHYALATMDLEYEYPFGWGELWGVANRGEYDLRCHMEASGQDLRYTVPGTKDKFLPFVIEPALGATRLVMALLLDAYHEEEVNGKPRVVLRLHPELAPYKAAVLPLTKSPELAGFSHSLFDRLTKERGSVDFDDGGSIGRRYRRHDEIGTPACLTVDFDSLQDGCVTVRDRDTMEQRRVSAEDPGLLSVFQ